MKKIKILVMSGTSQNFCLFLTWVKMRRKKHMLLMRNMKVLGETDRARQCFIVGI